MSVSPSSGQSFSCTPPPALRSGMMAMAPFGWYGQTAPSGEALLKEPAMARQRSSSVSASSSALVLSFSRVSTRREGVPRAGGVPQSSRRRRAALRRSRLRSGRRSPRPPGTPAPARARPRSAAGALRQIGGAGEQLSSHRSPSECPPAAAVRASAPRPPSHCARGGPPVGIVAHKAAALLRQRQSGQRGRPGGLRRHGQGPKWKMWLSRNSGAGRSAGRHQVCPRIPVEGEGAVAARPGRRRPAWCVPSDLWKRGWRQCRGAPPCR